jgi:hypothetical protein
MTTNPRYGLEQIETLARELDALPPKEAVSASCAQVIRRIAPQIRAMRTRGYSYAKIAEVLAEKGIVATPAAIRANLRRAGGQKTAKTTRAATRSSSTPPASSAITPREHETP